MSSILRDLYYGRICPAETPMDCGRDYQAHLDREEQTYEALLKGLAPGQKKALDQYLDQKSENELEEYAATFSKGVQFGVRLMLAVFEKEIAGEETP